jgi:hypothetical protein
MILQPRPMLEWYVLMLKLLLGLYVIWAFSHFLGTMYAAGMA